MTQDENDDPSEEEEPVAKVSHNESITLEILHVIKDAQSQHGLKHSDYHRYRAYCMRRIKRLRKSLNYVQATGSKSRGVYSMKRVTGQVINDASTAKKDPLRYLYIPLMCAERCWAHAMALKQEANSEHRKKFHLIRKLRKSVLYARELYQLCNTEPTKCDARTKLESQAYFRYLSGIYYFETEKWRKASASLQQAQAIYTKLCEVVGDEEQAVLYRQRLDELKPTLRFCAFNLGDQDSKDDFLDKLDGEQRPQDDYLASKLDQLIIQTREKQAVTLSEVNWLGKPISVKHEKIRAFLLSYKELEKVDNSTVAKLEGILFECRDCLQLLRDTVQEKTALYCYLLVLRHQLTCQRNLAITEGLQNNSELIRLYEVIIGCLSEIKSVPLQQYFNSEEIEVLLKQVDAKMLAYKAFRCYYIGKAGKLHWKQSVALLHKASQYSDACANNDFMDENIKKQVEVLKAKADGEKFTLYANSLMGEEEKPADPKDLLKPLVDRLEIYNENLQLASGSVPLAHFPPSFDPIACKPLFFDLAMNHIDMPSVESEMTASKASGITGFVKNLWGWKK